MSFVNNRILVVVFLYLIFGMVFFFMVRGTWSMDHGSQCPVVHGAEHNYCFMVSV